MSNSPHELELAALRRRRGAKWNRFGPDVLPAWVADIDFAPPAAVTESLLTSIELADLGYGSEADIDAFVASLRSWLQRHHGWQPDVEAVIPVTDVMQGVALAITRLSAPGEAVLMQTPAYKPFFRLLDQADRPLVRHPLTPDRRLDIDALASLVDPSVKILLLCNPQNPSGRVFAADELDALTALAIERDLVIVADEIWADLVYPPNRHRSIGTYGAEVADRSVIVTSGSKTFGLPGLPAAAAIVASPELRSTLVSGPLALYGHPSAVGIRAMASAWDAGDEWVAATVAYLGANASHAAARLAAELPGVVTEPPEATYLMWVDCRGLDLPDKPATLTLQRGRVALERGFEYGLEGEGFVRMNLATSRVILDQILDRVVAALGPYT